MTRNAKQIVEVEIKDNASDGLERIADSAEELDRQTTDVTVDADDRASDELNDIRDKLNRLDKDEAKVLIRAELKDARSDLRGFQRDLIDLDDAEAEVEVKADIATAKRRIALLRDEAEQLDRADPDVDVSVSGGEELSGLLDAMPGQVGAVGSALTGPAGPVAGMGALVAGAVAVADSQSNMALEAQTYADLVGIGVEEASRLITVAANAGIEMNDLADMALQLSGSLADAPEVAAQLGVNLSDGKAPGERLVEIFGLMNTSQLDANDKAQIFSKLLGEEGVRQGQRLATQIGDIEKAMEAVPDGAVFDEGDVADARAYRAQMAEVQNLLKSMAATVGGEVIPVLSEGMGDLSKLTDELGAVRDGFADMVPGGDMFGGVTEGAEGFSWVLAGMGIQQRSDELKDLSLTTDELAGSLVGVSKEAAVLGEKTLDATDAADEHRQALDAEAEALEESAAKLLDATEALEDQNDAKMAAADATFALHDAEDDLTDTIAESNAKLEDSETDLRGARQAMDAAAESASDLARAHVRVAEETATANGRTLTATERLDIMNTSMLDSAGTASGPLRQSIIDYIGAVNGIPASTMTDIQTAIDRGDIAEANRLLNNASRSRESAVTADANTYQANQELDWAARNRTANIHVTTSGKGPTTGQNGYFAKGTQGSPAGSFVVGEQGPELVELGRGDKVHDAGATKRKTRAGGGGGHTTVNNYFPPGTRPDDVARSTRRYRDVQGEL